MAYPLKRFYLRRLIASAITLAGLGIVVLFVWVWEQSLGDPARITGWFLLTALILLFALHIRKRITYPPLGRAAHWLQMHNYLGIAICIIYYMHAGIGWPAGRFEAWLAFFFFGAAITGILSIAISRILPRRIAALEEHVLFERIPRFRRMIREHAREKIQDAVNQSRRGTLADFYEHELLAFLYGPRHLGAHLLSSDRPLKRMIDRIRSLDRYLTEEERQIADDIEELVQQKYILDSHYVLQGLLKSWLFIHIAFTYLLLLYALCHVFLVHSMGGAT